jgi:hypothetical protein
MKSKDRPARQPKRSPRDFAELPEAPERPALPKTTPEPEDKDLAAMIWGPTNSTFDAEARAAEKQRARDEDARALEEGRISADELRRKNGAFAAFSKMPISWRAMPKRA